MKRDRVPAPEAVKFLDYSILRLDRNGAAVTVAIKGYRRGAVMHLHVFRDLANATQYKTDAAHYQVSARMPVERFDEFTPAQVDALQKNLIDACMALP